MSSEPRAWSKNRGEDEGYRLREDAKSQQKAAAQPENQIARAPVRNECGDGKGDEQADVDVAVPMLADEEYCHGIEGDPHEQGPTDGVSSCSHRDEREVEGDHERALSEEQVGAKYRPERDADVAGDCVEQHDDLEPERWPVQ